MKNKLFSIACLIVLLAPFASQAQFVDSRSSASQLGRVYTVREAKNEFGDNAHIVLEGYITGTAGTLNPEEYFFRDNTDSIKVEINPDVWRGQKVSPETKVRIAGEVDINRVNNTREIEVRRLDIIR